MVAAAGALGALGWAKESLEHWAENSLVRLEATVEARVEAAGLQVAQGLRAGARQRLVPTLALCLASIPIAVLYGRLWAPWVAAGIMAVPLLLGLIAGLGRLRRLLAWLAQKRQEAAAARASLKAGEPGPALGFLRRMAGLPEPKRGWQAAAATLAGGMANLSRVRDLLDEALALAQAWLRHPRRWLRPLWRGSAGTVGKGVLLEAGALLLAASLARGAVFLLLLAP